MKARHLTVGVILLALASACTPGSRATVQAAPTVAAPDATSAPPTATAAPPRLTPLPTRTPAPNLPSWPMLNRGDWDEATVFALQRLLRHHGIYAMADGKFGRQTEGAVRDFQSSRGLAADGIVAAATWSALVRDVTLEEGSEGEAVRGLEILLVRKFGYSIAEDGLFDAETAEAVRDFQAGVKHMPVDGIVGGYTWQALISITR